VKYSALGKVVKIPPKIIADKKTSNIKAGNIRIPRRNKKPRIVGDLCNDPATRNPLRAKNIGRIITGMGRYIPVQTIFLKFWP
jgi:hypothetical protein